MSVQEWLVLAVLVGFVGALLFVVRPLLAQNREQALALKDAIPPLVLETVLDAGERGWTAVEGYVESTSTPLDDQVAAALKDAVREVLAEYGLIKPDAEQ